MDTDSTQISPKTEPLPGSLHAEYSRCGKQTCHCAHGPLHGPYWRRVWRTDGRTRSVYVRLADVEQISQACAQYRALYPSGREFARRIRTLVGRFTEALAAVEPVSRPESRST